MKVKCEFKTPRYSTWSSPKSDVSVARSVTVKIGKYELVRAVYCYLDIIFRFISPFEYRYVPLYTEIPSLRLLLEIKV